MSDMRFINPLGLAIMRCLREQPEPLSEYQLLQLLAQRGDFFSGLSTEPQLALFQRHFIVMNALYELQKHLFDDQLYLSISALSIQLLPLQRAAGQALVEASVDEKLQAYYCDWSNFESTDEQGVEDLLNGFWQRYLSNGKEGLDKQAEALAVLELSAEANWPAVRASYRRLAAIHHPDRGGDAAQFMQIREAYERLSRTMAA